MTKQEILNTHKYAKASIILLRNNQDFKNEFINFAPNITADIQSASENSNCSCEERVMDYIENNLNLYIDFLYDYLVKNDVFVSFVTYLNSIVEYKDYGGKVAKTTISEWKNFYDSLNEDNAVFRSFSVVKENDDVLVFFL